MWPVLTFSEIYSIKKYRDKHRNGLSLQFMPGNGGLALVTYWVFHAVKRSKGWDIQGEILFLSLSVIGRNPTIGDVIMTKDRTLFNWKECRLSSVWRHVSWDSDRFYLRAESCTRFVSGHLRSLYFDRGLKLISVCDKCNLSVQQQGIFLIIFNLLGMTYLKNPYSFYTFWELMNMGYV